ncbi:MAG TPA: SusC/RagA family TonB-linked outer membrane protein [Longimicrobium sp.]|nr:SusC/RagA family TonB-linked outer membrane protein [Longimicrobium sp.]
MPPTRLRRWAGAALLGLVAALAAAPAAAQEPFTLRGTVVDAGSGRPLPGVAVTLRGTSLRTATNARGEYTLGARVAAGTYTLEATQLGRGLATRQVTLTTPGEVRVEPIPLRETALELEGLVVTGTGVSAERRQVGNTVATVSGEEIDRAPAAATVDQALQGKIPGAVISETSGQPGGGVSIRLRGTSTIFGGAEPLIVVDGVFIDNNDAALVAIGSNATRGGSAATTRLADIPPGDIERVEVLKGASAAALYGSRANSGVIQIFTKRGRQGRPQFTFSQELSSSETPARYELNMSPRAGYTDVTYVLPSGTAIGSPVQRFDLQDQIFRTGSGAHTQLAVSGGGEGSSYYLSGSYRDDEGILRGTGYNRITARGRLSQRLSRVFEVNASAAFTQSRTNLVQEGEQTNGLLTTVIFTPTTFNPEFNETTGRFPFSPVPGFAANPLDILENWDLPEDVVRFTGSLETSATPLPNLNLRWLLALDDYRQESRFFRPPFSLAANDAGSVANPIRLSRQVNSDLTASYDWELRPSLSLNTTGGFRYSEDRADVISTSATNLAPGQELLGGGTQFASQSYSEIRTVGGFLQERVSLADRLFVTGGLNVEGSSAFGADQRWQLFPRVGVSYVVDQDPVWERLPVGDVLSTLRVRAAYGETGSQPPGAYLRFENYTDTAYSGLSGYVASTTRGNPDLKPERQREYEAGFEAGFFQDRASVEFTAYDQLTRDLVLPVPLPVSQGAQQQYQNVGEISNKGFELALNSVNVSRRSFTWRSRLTYARNSNRIERLFTGTDTLMTAQLGGDYLNAVIVGQPIGIFYGGVYERDAAGNIVYRRVTADSLLLPSRARDTIRAPDGSIVATPFARRIIGNPHPDFTATFSNTFEIGERVQLGFLLDGRFGNDVTNFTRRIMEQFGTAKVVEREIAGDTTFRTYSLNPASRAGIFEEFVEDGSFVKLREVSLQYSIPEAWAGRFGATGASIRLSGRNLHTWTDYSGLDPEVNLFGTNAVARGLDFAVTPIPRSWVVGVNFNF